MANEKPKRIALWTHPRSLSTAMVMSLGNYGNVEVFNEMYGGAFAFGPEKNPTVPMPFPIEEDLTFRAVKSQLEAAYPGRDLVLLKDHAVSLNRNYDNLPAGFTHTFLIRDPAQMVISNHKMGVKGGMTTDQFAQMSQSMLGKTQGYKDLVDLVDHVENTLKQQVVLLDADDLRRNPEKMLCAFCKALDLPFRESLLKWEPITDIPWHIPKSLLFFSRANGAYESALKSSGWITSDPSPPDLSSLPGVLVNMMEDIRPFYEKLYAKRLRP